MQSLRAPFTCKLPAPWESGTVKSPIGTSHEEEDLSSDEYFEYGMYSDEDGSDEEGY